jgi:hypothetical protein
MNSTFDSQISSVFRHPLKKDLYIALADRWLVDFAKGGRPDIQNCFYRMFSPDKDELPPAKEVDLGSLTKQNTSIADYVWLPIRFTSDGLYIEWLDEWRIEDFE